MPTYYIDLGNVKDGIVLTCKVKAPTEEGAVEGLKRMLYYRLGEAGNCGFNADGGRMNGSEVEVGDVCVHLDPEVLTKDNIVEEDDNT